MSNRNWRSDDPYVRMKLDILATAQPIYTGRWGLNSFEVRYSPEIVAQLNAVDQMRCAYEQFLLNLRHDHYNDLRSGDDRIDAVLYAMWDSMNTQRQYGMGWVPLFGDGGHSQMANYNARSAT